MFKVYAILLALAIGSASALQANEGGAGEASGAPEPYAYSYQTDSASAAEQRGADGRVTGYYTITDPTDGRERRVEYVADAAGFRAKVATNEVGTKSENPADVEMQASPPTEAQYAAQYAYQQFAQQYGQQQQQRQVVTNQQVVAQAVPLTVSTATQYASRPAVASGYSRQQSVYYQPGTTGYSSYGYGYYPGAYGTTYAYVPGVYSTYGTNQNVAYGGYGVGGLQGVNGVYYQQVPNGQYYNLGAQGLRSYTTTTRTTQGYGQPQVVGTRYVTSSAVRNVPVNSGSYYSSYSSGVPQVTGSSSSSSRTVTTSSSSGGNQGSGNLLVLKK